MRKPLNNRLGANGPPALGANGPEDYADDIADIIDDIIFVWFIFNKMEYLTIELSSTSII